MTDILSRIKSPGDLVNNQGAKILMYGASGALVKQLHLCDSTW
jgi:hypothetical protein